MTYANFDPPMVDLAPGWCKKGDESSHEHEPNFVPLDIQVGPHAYRWQCPCCGEVREFDPADIIPSMPRCCRAALDRAHNAGRAPSAAPSR